MLNINILRSYLMAEGIIIGFSDMLTIGQTIGLAGTMVLTLIFSKKHIQNLSIHERNRAINDLDEKVHNMADIIMKNQ